MMLAADREKAYLYDMTEGKLLEDNSVLSDFVASHSNGGLVMAVSDKEIDVKVMADSGEEGDESAGRKNTASDDGTDGAGGSGTQILYMACRTGLYRYIWGGSVLSRLRTDR